MFLAVSSNAKYESERSTSILVLTTTHTRSDVHSLVLHCAQDFSLRSLILLNMT